MYINSQIFITGHENFYIKNEFHFQFIEKKKSWEDIEEKRRIS